VKKISGDIPPLFAGNINFGGNLLKFRIAIASRIQSSEILKNPQQKKSPDTTSRDLEFLAQFSQQQSIFWLWKS
jgi:hypothetical protein